MVNATTLARVKRLVPIASANTDFDAALTDLIAAISREFERYLGYELLLVQRTERYHVDRGDDCVTLRVIPVVTVDEVKVATNAWDFASVTALVVDTDYHARVGEVGQVFFPVGILVAGPEALQVKYTAGLGASDAAVITAAPDIAWAADMQIAEEWRRRSEPAAANRPGPKGARQFVGGHEMLPRVRELLATYRRFTLSTSAPAPRGF